MTRLLTLVALALSVPAFAGGDDHEREARELEALLIAPCCFRQQVSIHQSEAAGEVRRDIRRRLAAGEARDQILAAYVRRYGKQILAVPPAEGFDRVLHLLPPVGLVLSAAVVAALVRRFTRRRVIAPCCPGSASDARNVEGAYAAVLDDALREMD